MNLEQLANIGLDLAHEIKQEVEWLETTEGDSVECISVENLEGIFKKYFGFKLRISQS
jgi:hypothetical protein